MTHRFEAWHSLERRHVVLVTEALALCRDSILFCELPYEAKHVKDSPTGGRVTFPGFVTAVAGALVAGVDVDAGTGAAV